MESKIILDTNIFLGIFFGNNEKCKNLQDFLLSEDSDNIVIMCKTLLNEIHRNLGKGHSFVHLFHQHVIRLFIKNNRYQFGEESSIPSNCIVSHKNDIHLACCAIGNKCKYIITQDEDLEMSPECNLLILSVDNFLKTQFENSSKEKK